MRSVATCIDTKGWSIAPQVLSAEQCQALIQAIGSSPMKGAGTRNMLKLRCMQDVLVRLRSDLRLAEVLTTLVAVQCSLFDKSKANNWLVPVHQDVSLPGLAASSTNQVRWSQKEGQQYFQPDAQFLKQVLAVRVHLDAACSNSGALEVVPNSHRLGKIEPARYAEVARQLGRVTCAVAQGDAMLMRPLLLHASAKSTGASQRRVLHFVFCPKQPPPGVRWLHAL